MTKNFNRLMERALELARYCEKSPHAFSVGAVILNSQGKVVGEGYSRQLGEQTHAEQNAIEVAQAAGESLLGATIVTTMEPCSIRLSGLRTCSEAIRQAGISRVVFAQREPQIFVECRGCSVLSSAGIELIELSYFAQAAASINQHLAKSRANIVFDWSGTISDDLSLVYNATMEVFRHYNIQLIEYAEFRREFKIPYMGFYEKYAANVDREQARKIFQLALSELKYPEAYPGAVDFVTECWRRGHKLAVFSGLPQQRLNHEVQALGLSKVFVDIRGSIYDKTQEIAAFLQHNKFKPSGTIVIGDMAHDVAAARSVGARVIALSWGYESHEVLEAAKPDYLLRGITEASDLIFE